MSARPWRVESRIEGASAWHEDRNFGAYATGESALNKAGAWKRFSGNSREYRALNIETAEVLRDV